MTFGLDYSAAPPDLGCAKANGVGFVVRYLEPADDWKTLTAAEVARIKAVGIDLVACYEAKAAAPLGGFTIGVEHARGVLAESVKVGMPTDRPIYFAVDFNATAAQLQGPVREYFRGIGSVLPLSRIGGYGGLNAIRYLFDNELIHWGWQTYAWSNGQWDQRAQLQQYNNSEAFCGGTVDYNRSMSVDFGQWSKAVTLYPSGYGTAMVPLDKMMASIITHGHPEYVRRLRAWLIDQGGEVGIGSAWRETGAQPDKPGFAPEGQSFHQDQRFRSGFVGCAAVDLVAAVPGSKHRAPTWAEVLPQGGTEAKRWGLHCNNSQESWHMQPTELDGWQSWVNAGRPDPVKGYPIPVSPPPPPPDPIPPEDDVVTEEDIKAIAAAVHQYQLGDVVKGEMRPAGDIMRENAFYAHQAANIVPVSDAGGGTVDVKALAVAVADELAKRLEG